MSAESFEATKMRKTAVKLCRS